jgi:hypothetical protein
LRQAYLDLVRNVYSRVNTRPAGRPVTSRPGPEDSEVLVFLFIGAAGDVRPATAVGVSSSYYYQFLNASFTTAKLNASTPFRKLYAAWLEKERYALVMRRALDIAAQHGVKECAPTALTIAADTTTAAMYRASALIAFGKLADKQNVKDLEPFLKDKLQIGANVFIGGNERGSVQMRDVALGAAVQLAGQNLADFGFERRPPASVSSLSTYTYFAFATDEKRDAAHAKWKEWVEKNLKK